MMAIVNMLNYMPKSIIKQHIEMTMPVLLYSLNKTNVKNEQLWLNSLKSFELLIDDSLKNNDQHLNEFTGQILERLLSMCMYEANMDIRLLALKCVNNIAKNISPNKIIKYQKLVCKQLAACLGDRKRLCRQLAVEARNRWFLITTKTNET